MANNLMFLKSKHTGKRVCLAKFYPSTGWYVMKTILDLNALLHEHSFGDVPYDVADKEGILAKGGMFDSNSFELEFDEPSSVPKADSNSHANGIQKNASSSPPIP